MHICQTLSPKPPLCLPLGATIRHHAGHTVTTHGEETLLKGEHSFSERGGNKGNGVGEGNRDGRTPCYLEAGEIKAETVNDETLCMQSWLSRP